MDGWLSQKLWNYSETEINVSTTHHAIKDSKQTKKWPTSHFKSEENFKIGWKSKINVGA